MAGPVTRTPLPRFELFSEAATPRLLAVAAIVVTAFRLGDDRLIARPLLITLFVLTSVLALSTLPSWAQLPQNAQIVLLTGYGLCAAILLPLGQSTLTRPSLSQHPEPPAES
ncbi:hypothetical protein [Amycolatopsis panacis]|uniref:Uncharacterized protein n=1 Tax=Amycolatopsis panacis TaxID=2340917 RepID=A0A419I5D9_9PSEU|nr:hypothetical protein [Amycolatopsis panacis]RJQ85961.1 hypothetical protein D5S19_12270 [Amycolatopsis panacis]